MTQETSDLNSGVNESKIIHPKMSRQDNLQDSQPQQQNPLQPKDLNKVKPGESSKWLPTLLRGDEFKWTDKTIENEYNSFASVNDKDAGDQEETSMIYHNSEVNNSKVEADWKKYAENQFQKPIKHTTRLKSMFDVSPIPHDHSKLGINNESYNTSSRFDSRFDTKQQSIKSLPRSPLKVFGNRHNTYTRVKMDGLLNDLVSDGTVPKNGHLSDYTDSTNGDSVEFTPSPTKRKHVFGETNDTDFQVTMGSENFEENAERVYGGLVDKNVLNFKDFESSNDYTSDSSASIIDHDLPSSVRIHDVARPTAPQSEEDHRDSPRSTEGAEQEESEDDGEEEVNVTLDNNSSIDTSISAPRIKALNSIAESRGEWRKQSDTLVDRIDINALHKRPTKIPGMVNIPPEELEKLVYNKKLGGYIPTTTDISGNSNDSSQDQQEFKALDDISDLLIDSRHNTNQAATSKISVSFALPPEEEQESKAKQSSLKRVSTANLDQDDLNDVTNISDVRDLSFSQSKETVVALLTEIYPDGDWTQMITLDISNKDLQRLVHLDDYTPELLDLNVSFNKLKYLADIPRHIRTIVASHNLLNDMAVFDHCRNLQLLDISHNNISTLRQIRLPNIKKLIINNNMVESLNGLEDLNTLTTLDLSHNLIKGTVDFKNMDFVLLEDLNLSDNDIKAVQGLSSLKCLRVFNIGNNNLTKLEINETMSSLKKLDLKNNVELMSTNIEKFPRLRSLCLDGNTKLSVTFSKKLEKLSAKLCSNEMLFNNDVEMIYLRWLDLSGITNLDFDRLKEPFINVNYLNLSAASMKQISQKFTQMFPNVNTLNLNFNMISDVSPLGKLKYLRKLFLINNRISSLNDIYELSFELRNQIKYLDVRMNPATKEFYPHVFLSEQEDELPIEEENIEDLLPQTLDGIDAVNSQYKSFLSLGGDEDWNYRDYQYTKKLDKTREQKKAEYQIVILGVCTKLKFFDGKIVTKDDINEAMQMLKKLDI
ncbi:BA75_03816T0 [Komagataella pastoris]|uniref:BA75_03816T0 n=1 Tax=Komagataella pastoris TaxID=4922 RepID=A0A1B2JH12_PICPA|nr:BA75_03816T0 [Komagataella pastoris]